MGSGVGTQRSSQIRRGAGFCRRGDLGSWFLSPVVAPRFIYAFGPVAPHNFTDSRAWLRRTASERRIAGRAVAEHKTASASADPLAAG